MSVLESNEMILHADELDFLGRVVADSVLAALPGPRLRRCDLRGTVGKFVFDPVGLKRYDHDLVIYESVDRGIFYVSDYSLLHTELHTATKISDPVRSEGYQNAQRP